MTDESNQTPNDRAYTSGVRDGKNGTPIDDLANRFSDLVPSASKTV